jgi:hypothetical protein
MAQDFDDIVWMGHTCHSAVFASLAVAEHEGRDARAMVTAVVAGNEIGGRLGASSFAGPLNGQMWTFVHLVSAAAATASLLGLDAERTAHALAIALAQPTFALQPGFLLPGSKLLAASTPTATGIQAAYFARAGLTGHPRILEDPRGFWSRFSYLPLREMLGDLGSFWVTETLAIKTYPGCHYFQTALTAIDRIRARRGSLGPDDVRAMRISTTKLACEATRFASEYVRGAGLTPVSVAFDLALSAAVLVHAGRISSEEIDAGWLARHETELRALAARIDVRHEPALTARVVASVGAIRAGRRVLRSVGPRDLWRLVRRYREDYRSSLTSPRDALAFGRALAWEIKKPRAKITGSAVPLAFPSRVEIDLRDGGTEREEVDVPVASFSSPGCEAELAREVLRECAPALGDAGARALLDTGLDVEARGVPALVGAALTTRDR